MGGFQQTLTNFKRATISERKDVSIWYTYLNI